MLKITYHPIFKHNLSLGHRFPMSKHELLRSQLIHEGHVHLTTSSSLLCRVMPCF